jgi:hypothetical protein
VAKKSGSKFRNWLLGMPTAAVLLPIQGLSLIYWWIAGSYLGVDTYTSRSFVGQDGWCSTVSQGIGSHCWGDYYYPLILVSSLSDPLTVGYQNAGPAASFIPFMISSVLGTIIGFGHAGLIIFLGSMTLLIGWSVWVGTKGMTPESRIILFTTITLFSPPLITTLDRGNSVGFIIPLLVWLYWALRQKAPNQAMLSIVLLTIVKPHFAVLILLFLIRGQFREFVKAALLGGTIHILAYLAIAGHRFPTNMFEWLAGLNSYQDYISVSSGWPQNISFAQSIFSFASFFCCEQNSNTILYFLAAYQGLIGPMVLFTVLSAVLIFRNFLSDVQIAIILTSLISMTSSTSFYYYAVFAIPAILLLTQTQIHRKGIVSPANPEQTSTSHRIDFIIWVALVLTLIQLPMYELDSQTVFVGSNDVFIATTANLVVTTANLVGGFWILAYILIFTVVLKGRTKTKTKTIL